MPTLQQLLDTAYKTYAQDKASTSANVRYPPYPGKTIAPMSSLTQRARDLQQQFAQQGKPYANKLNLLKERPNPSDLFSRHTQDLLGNLNRSQGRFNEDIGLAALRKQFGSSFTPEQQQAFRARGSQDIEKGLREFEEKLQPVREGTSSLEKETNARFAKTLMALQADKELRQQGLIGNLEQFGNQQHAAANKMLASERAKFYDQADSPQRRLEQLRASLEPIGNRMAQGPLHPDLEKSTAQEIQNALDYYKSIQTPYTEKTVADLNPEMQSSYDILERINPKMKDTYYQKRKDIIQALLQEGPIGVQALQGVAPNMQGQIAQLEETAGERIQKDLAEINNKYMRLGQFGSPQHISEAEQRGRAINKALLENRNKITEDTLQKQIALQHERAGANLENLNVAGIGGHKEFFDVLNNARNMNALGTTKWQNQQSELERKGVDYITQRDWGRPQTSRDTDVNAIFGNDAAVNLGLNNQTVPYSEQKPPYSQFTANNPINTTTEAQQQLGFNPARAQQQLGFNPRASGAPQAIASESNVWYPGPRGPLDVGLSPLFKPYQPYYRK